MLFGIFAGLLSATSLAASDNDPRQVRVGNLIYADDKTPTRHIS